MELVLVCLVDAGLLIEGAGEPGRILADAARSGEEMGVLSKDNYITFCRRPYANMERVYVGGEGGIILTLLPEAICKYGSWFLSCGIV